MHHTAGEGNEPSTVDVYHDGVDLFERLVIMILLAAEEFGLLDRFGLEVQFLVIEDADLDSFLAVGENVGVLVLPALNGNIYFLINGYIFKCYFYQLFRCPQFRNVPNALR